MSDTLSKILNIVLLVLIGIGTAVALYFYFGGEVPTELDIVGGGNEPKGTDLFMNIGYLYAILAVFFTVGFAVLSLVVNFRSAINTLIGIAALCTVAFIGYMMSSDAIFTIQGAEEPITASVSKNVGTGLFTTYILLAMAAVAIVYTEVAARFK